MTAKSSEHTQLPRVGDTAPPFEVLTEKGLVRFPEFSKGSWCIFFAHPANFTSAWRMYSNFLAMKERWLQERNAKLLALSNQSARQSDWTDVVRRYIGIFLKAPIIEDRDNRISALYGMSPSRRIVPPNHRLLYIIDPEGIIRLIVNRPLASIQTAMADLEAELDRLQRNIPQVIPPPSRLEHMMGVPEGTDVQAGKKPKPAYFRSSKFVMN
ncbi:MAG: redoxin domain-containing protein [Saprospiraceae bacterium]